VTPDAAPVRPLVSCRSCNNEALSSTIAES